MPASKMGDSASLTVTREGDFLSAIFDDGNGHVAEIANSFGRPEHFEWLIRSAANFHRINFQYQEEK